MSPRKTLYKNKVHLDLLIEEDLKVAFEKHATDLNTTMTALVTAYIRTVVKNK